MAKQKKIKAPKVHVPKVFSCQYVEKSDLFEGLQELHDFFCESEPDMFWGDNNRTLNLAEGILDHIAGRIDELTDKDKQNGWDWEILTPQWKDLKKRISFLPEGGQTYVDLEN
jgi:hypothetical protein